MNHPSTPSLLRRFPRGFGLLASGAVFLVAVACTKPHADPQKRPSNRGPVRYLALGDSFTAGSGATLSQAFPQRLASLWRLQGCDVEIRNVAVPGFTSEDVITRELAAVSAFQPTIVTLAIGANDIVHGHATDSYEARVGRILDSLRSSGARVVVLPQPDWSRSPAAAPLGEQASLADAIGRFNAVLERETRRTGNTWVDLVPLMRSQADRGMVASDGLHPSAAAYEAWATELARVLPLPCGGM